MQVIAPFTETSYARQRRTRGSSGPVPDNRTKTRAVDQIEAIPYADGPRHCRHSPRSQRNGPRIARRPLLTCRGARWCDQKKGDERGLAWVAELSSAEERLDVAVAMAKATSPAGRHPDAPHEPANPLRSAGVVRVYSERYMVWQFLFTELRWWRAPG
ncbi:hypothetical protein HPB50_000893 [Hyalomma asiaticum]|uniref:Uncharacterized protein n=1 Tax=Hyalomma asiaticum TaxID=266040 RepID=A0ACB7SAD8_HYAAI|nr:hypothetical protein HPB50_000893 [Hyalomma asiaticum]